MDNRIAIVGVVIEEKESVEKVNDVQIGRASCRERV